MPAEWLFLLYTCSLEDYTSVLRAKALQVAARIRVGGRPVHAYSINQTNTVWSHSDAEGTFYVIAVNNSQNLTVATTVPVS